MTHASHRWAAEFPSPPWSHPPVIGGVASPPAADLAGRGGEPDGVKLRPANGLREGSRAAGSLADDDNPSEVIVLLAASLLCRDRPGSAWALAGLPEPSQGSPGRPRHRGRRPRSPEERATPPARTGAAQLSILRHGVRAVESPVPVGRLVTPLRLVGPFGRSNGPCEGQRAVPMPARLTRRLNLAWTLECRPAGAALE